MSRIMFLGGGPMQLPPIVYAKNAGHFIVTVDYLPANPGHRYADEYVNVSITDKEAVLDAARRLGVDGIVAYASDIAAPTAAFVAQELGLPGNPYESVLTLTHKGRFRRFLRDNGFNCPRADSFASYDDARAYVETLEMPVFVKPVDSAGSKGVTRIESLDELEAAYRHAIGTSMRKEVIVEETIVRDGYQVAGDGFIVDGRLAFRCFANEHFDKLVNGLVPIGESFPAIHDPGLLQHAHEEYQRVLTLLSMNRGALNFDFVFTPEGDLYLLELGPRNGGNLIPEVTRLATGVDMIKHTVDMALGLTEPELEIVPCEGWWASYIVHATRAGRLKEIAISDHLQQRIVQQDITASRGDQVEPFIGSNFGLGSMILRFDDRDEMLHMMDNMEQYIEIRTE